MKKYISIAGLSFMMALTGCNDNESDSKNDNHDKMEQTAKATDDVVMLAQQKPELSTLVTAIQAAGLADTLATTDNITVFAPTNKAFTKLFEKLGVTSTELLANTELLDSVLKYHVIASEVKKADIPFNTFIPSLNGNGFKINEKAQIMDATGSLAQISMTDIMAKNGVIHVIDDVILPPNKTIVELAAGTEDLSILVEAVTKAGLVDALSGKGNFTVFAPTNDAFAKALTELNISKEDLLARSDLADILKYHVLAAKAYSNQLPVETAATLQGENISVSAEGKITDANGRMSTITNTDIQATNGVVHLIDTVILPKL